MAAKKKGKSGTTKAKVKARPAAKAAGRASAKPKAKAVKKAAMAKAAAKKPAKAAAKAKAAAPRMMLMTIEQIIPFPEAPEAIYEMIMDEKKHAAFTGAAAKVSRKVGGEFSAHDGFCHGTHLELIPGKKIVQNWRAKDWPEDHYSTATFAFAKVPGGCRLTFTQVGVPEKEFKGISSGWYEFYWEPMLAMLDEE